MVHDKKKRKWALVTMPIWNIIYILYWYICICKCGGLEIFPVWSPSHSRMYAVEPRRAPWAAKGLKTNRQTRRQRAIIIVEVEVEAEGRQLDGYLCTARWIFITEVSCKQKGCIWFLRRTSPDLKYAPAAPAAHRVSAQPTRTATPYQASYLPHFVL